jgi:hypothetical protein
MPVILMTSKSQAYSLLTNPPKILSLPQKIQDWVNGHDQWANIPQKAYTYTSSIFAKGNDL